mmetsp:Transcript_12340/g.32483  ORF Transcript_12340/g.32483 Transcript_12340/m.32483 type:complete len:232 (+) Transcript_12340:1638-2333(+)
MYAQTGHQLFEPVVKTMSNSRISFSMADQLCPRKTRVVRLPRTPSSAFRAGGIANSSGAMDKSVSSLVRMTESSSLSLPSSSSGLTRCAAWASVEASYSYSSAFNFAAFVERSAAKSLTIPCAAAKISRILSGSDHSMATSGSLLCTNLTSRFVVLSTFPDGASPLFLKRSLISLSAPDSWSPSNCSSAAPTCGADGTMRHPDGSLARSKLMLRRSETSRSEIRVLLPAFV